MSAIYSNIEKSLLNYQNEKNALLLQRYFKTSKGQYGEGDRFLGIKVPIIRDVVKKYLNELTVNDIEYLLSNKWHEVRYAGIVGMLAKYKIRPNQLMLYNLYLSQIGKAINSWDLVDISCPHIIGNYLIDKKRDVLYDLAMQGLWQKRVSIISTFYFLKKGQTKDTYNLSQILIHDPHDLIQKAVGWALREMGTIDNDKLLKFLDDYAATMPRTALRYSLEKQSYETKNHYMSLKDVH